MIHTASSRGAVSAQALGPSTDTTTISRDNATIATTTGVCTVTCTVRDCAGAVLAGVTPVLAVDGTGNTLTAFGASNASGIATGSFTTTQAATKTISVTVGGRALASTLGTVASGTSDVTSVTRVSPASGDSIGTKAVTITVVGATGTPTVTFGGVSATSIVVASSTSITCVTPAGTAGAQDVVVGTQTLAGGYIYRGGTYTRPTLTRNTAVDKYCDAAQTGSGHAGTSGDPYTLAEMQAALTNGWRVYMKGDFGADAYLSLSGKGTATDGIIFIKWPGESQPILRGGGASQYSAVNLNTSHYIVLEDLNLYTEDDDAEYAIDAHGGDYCQVVDCTLVGGSIMLGGGCTNWYIKGNAIGTVGGMVGNAGDGIYLRNGDSDNVIVQNTITTCGHAAIDITQGVSGDASCTDNTIAYNTITNPWAGGIILGGKSLRTICECNDVSDSATNAGATGAGTQNGIEVLGTDNIVRYNRVWGCRLQGIGLLANSAYGYQSCDGNHVHNNAIFGCGCYPIGMTAHLLTAGETDTMLLDNTVENNLAWGNHTNGAVYPNGGWYEDNYYSVWVTAVWTTPLNGNVFRNNLLARTVATDRFLIRVLASNVYYNTPAALEAAFATSADNLTDVDPGLADVANDKLWPAAVASAAVDVGYATTGVVYLGAAPDIGAYEVA